MLKGISGSTWTTYKTKSKAQKRKKAKAERERKAKEEADKKNQQSLEKKSLSEHVTEQLSVMAAQMQNSEPLAKGKETAPNKGNPPVRTKTRIGQRRNASRAVVNILLDCMGKLNVQIP